MLLEERIKRAEEEAAEEVEGKIESRSRSRSRRRVESRMERQSGKEERRAESSRRPKRPSSGPAGLHGNPLLPDPLRRSCLGDCLIEKLHNVNNATHTYIQLNTTASPETKIYRPSPQ